jgi:phosphatidylserine/phosphatidylglycerophosphate/cardiolipin synthase-like enzyme
MRRSRRLLMLVLVPSFVSAAESAKDSIEVYFSPHGGCTDAVVRQIAQAKQSLRIQAYSFAIIEAQKRGVKVETLLDKSNRTDRYSAATFLKNQGVDVLIDDQHAIAHNKIMIIDEAVVITGSFNFSKAAEESNAENLLIIRGQPDLVQKYVANYDAHRAHSQVYEPATGTEGAPEKRGAAGDNSADVKFVGSKNSDVYHYPNCADVKKIKPENLVKYKAAPEGKRLHKGCPK